MSRLDRLSKLYARVERARLIEARAAQLAADEVKLALEHAAAEAETELARTRDAVVQGDAVGWKQSEALRSANIIHAERLQQLQAQRRTTLDAAESLHRESRLRSEQMERLVAHWRERTALEEGRKSQAAADDRYGSRLKWRQRENAHEEPLI